jgi:predicted translin family RNA/ssDNA-binding protein
MSTEPVPSVRITMRELYDAIVRIDQKVTTLTEGRIHDAQQREQMSKRIDEIERTLESLRTRVMAWPSLAGAAAVVAIVVALVPRFTQ